MEPLSEPEDINQIHPSNITDEFVQYLMRTKSIPTFRFVEGVLDWRKGVAEPVPALPQREFDWFILGLINVDALFRFVARRRVYNVTEGLDLFNWSIHQNTDPSWALGYRRITEAKREEVIALYCNLWARRAREEFGCKFPIQNQISIDLRPKEKFEGIDRDPFPSEI